MVHSKNLVLFPLLVVLSFTLLLSTIRGRSLMLSFVYTVKGEVAEEVKEIENKEEIIESEEEKDLDTDNASDGKDADSPEVIEDEEPKGDGEVDISLDKKDEGNVDEKELVKNEIPEEDSSVISSPPPVSTSTKEDTLKSSLLAAYVSASVHVVNNSSSHFPPTRNAKSFPFVRINDDGSETFVADENCTVDNMSCDKMEIDSVGTGYTHFFNLIHQEFLDYQTDGFLCEGSEGPIDLPIADAGLGNLRSCTLTYNYIDPKLDIITPDGTYNNVKLDFSGKNYGDGVSSNGAWKVKYTTPTGNVLSPDNNCFSSSPYITLCYDFSGDCSGSSFDSSTQKQCRIEESGGYATATVNGIAVKNYPPSNNDEYMDFGHFNISMKDSTDNDLTIMNDLVLLPGGGFYYPKKYVQRTFITYDLTTSLHIANTSLEGYEFLGCKERNNATPLQNEIIYNSPTDISSEIDCFYKALPAQLKISKSNNSSSGGVGIGEVVDFRIEIKAPIDSLPTTYILQQTELYDKLPIGINYKKGSMQANSTVRGSLTFLEPEYSGGNWAIWQLGKLMEGEVVTLTYQATMGSELVEGTYMDKAYVKGLSVVGEEVLGVGDNGTEFVSTEVKVVKRKVVKESGGINLPDTGANTYISILSLLSLLAGIFFLSDRRFVCSAGNRHQMEES